MIYVRYTLAAMEALHSLLHCQVLFAMGKLYSVTELEKKRDYFILDMFTVMLSCLYLTYIGCATPTTYILATMHNVLHFYYITNWTMKENFFIVSIREWSAESDLSKRIEKNGKPLFLYNTMGTIFDIYVHMYMIERLLVIRL